MTYDDTNREIDQWRILPVPGVVLLDLDRCLFDTNAFVAAFYNTLDPELAASLRGTQVQLEASGGSFDLASEIRRRVGRDAWHQLQRRFLETHDEAAYLNEGADDLLGFLRDKGIPHAILTYGGEEWQRLKRRVARLEHIPMIVVDRKEKGGIISGWMNSDGQFAVPINGGGQPLLASYAILVDDKIEAFMDAPERMFGVWVRTGRSKGLESSYMPAVRAVGDLAEAARAVADSLQRAEANA